MAELMRRNVLGGLGGCACCAGLGMLIPSASGQSIPKGGCGVPVPDIPKFEPRVLQPESLAPGARAFRSAFAKATSNIADARTAAIRRLATTFRVAPPFDFYNDEDAPNARAFRPTSSYPQGKVVFGMRLYNDLMTEDPSGASVLAVLAHEFGHITLFLSNVEQRLMANRPTVKRMELHADYLAGFHLGLRKRDAPQVSLLRAGKLIWSLGDEERHSEDHHGTSQERNRAAEAGFALGFSEAPPFPAAFDAATRYILETYANDPL